MIELGTKSQTGQIISLIQMSQDGIEGFADQLHLLTDEHQPIEMYHYSTFNIQQLIQQHKWLISYIIG